MPVSPLIPALIGSIIESVADQGAASPTPALVDRQGPAVGIVRTLPAESATGEMKPPGMSTVEIDGKTLPLSIAVQFRDEQNLIIPSAAIRQPVRVRYLTEGITGAVWRVWILTPAELAASAR